MTTPASRLSQEFSNQITAQSRLTNHDQTSVLTVSKVRGYPLKIGVCGGPTRGRTAAAGHHETEKLRKPRCLDSGQERDCTSLAGALGHQAPGSRDSLGQDTGHHTLGFQEHSVLSLTSALTVAPVIRNIEIKWNSSDEEIITALEMVQPFLSDHIRAFLFNQQFWFLIPFVHVGDREEVMRHIL